MIRKTFLLILLGLCASGMATRNQSAFAAETAGVLLGPCGSTSAIGPTSDNDDYTNRSIANEALGLGATTVRPDVVVFKNTVQNTGSVDDAYIISLASLPNGFVAEVSTDFGESYMRLEAWTTNIVLPVAYRASVTFLIRITAPAGLPTLASFDTVFRATSTISPVVTNETIDRIYTGFLKLDKSVRVLGSTSSGDAGSAGAELEFTITYSNISTSDGIGCALLLAQNIVINENGNASPNNWGARTDHIVGAYDSRGGLISGDRDGSTALSDQVMSLDPGSSGVFKFKRRVR